ncbi:uncharacterized protein LOC8081236 [Sorghum bicolor]|uniref:DUF1618 domain-containing protein n=1 Tax=Sorghum bicolor TaxID=4558 RepID=C5WX36_SORBI|nr:uncharacterized protein LOC8081236 [Sorghum bicolor]EER90724.1 hypothetical protein SORBI_3001G053500 [Sorghum bicolor]|eukprot:XP_002463726.1 uncharacterized protein LOC8081236 [Sorghum bicolor]
MPAAQPPFPIYVLNCVVDTADLTGKPEPGRGRAWSEIPCASRRAYGCGNNIQEAVEGLVLYARLDDAPHLNSSLAIRMSEGARRRFELELDPDYYRRRDAKLPSDLIGIARVEMAEEHGITAIILCFTRPGFFYHQSDLVYYLVYDSISRSLSMFHKCVYDGVCSLKTVVPKRTDGGDDYKLFLLGHKVSSPKDDVLWVGSLSSSDGGTGVPAKLKSMDFPRGLIHKRFKVDVAFSCQRKAFWGDLKQGLLYYDRQTSDFGFIKLPREYKVDMDSGGDEPVPPVTYSRTMGCVGDSIWFVCIDVPSHYTNAVVCIWELVLPEEQEQEQVKGKGAGWKEVVEEVPAKVLWELSSFKKAGLPAAPLQYPILTPDGALCFDRAGRPEQIPKSASF